MIEIALNINKLRFTTGTLGKQPINLIQIAPSSKRAKGNQTTVC